MSTLIALHLLLRHVGTDVGRAMVVLVAVGAAIVCLNDVFEFVAVRVATDGSYAAALGAAGSNALVLVLFDLQHYAFLIAQISFGLWLLPLGHLAYRSGMFAKALGVRLNVAGVCYLVDLLALFLVPDLGKQIGVPALESCRARHEHLFYFIRMRSPLVGCTATPAKLIRDHRPASQRCVVASAWAPAPHGSHDGPRSRPGRSNLRWHGAGQRSTPNRTLTAAGRWLR